MNPSALCHLQSLVPKPYTLVPKPYTLVPKPYTLCPYLTCTYGEEQKGRGMD